LVRNFAATNQGTGNMAKTSAQQSTYSTTTGQGTVVLRSIPRSAWIVTGVALIVTASATAYLLPVRSEPFSSPGWIEYLWNGWETTPEVRLPVLDGEPVAVHVAKDGGRVWIVGENSVLRSADHGDTWSVTTLSMPTPEEILKHINSPTTGPPEEAASDISSSNATTTVPNNVAPPTSGSPNAVPSRSSPAAPLKGYPDGKPGPEQKSSVDKAGDDEFPSQFAAEPSSELWMPISNDSGACAEPAAPVSGTPPPKGASPPPPTKSAPIDVPPVLPKPSPTGSVVNVVTTTGGVGIPLSPGPQPRIETVSAQISTSGGRRTMALWVGEADRLVQSPLAVFVFNLDDGKLIQSVPQVLRQSVGRSSRRPALFVFENITYLKLDGLGFLWTLTQGDGKWNRLEIPFDVDAGLSGAAIVTSPSGGLLVDGDIKEFRILQAQVIEPEKVVTIGGPATPVLASATRTVPPGYLTATTVSSPPNPRASALPPLSASSRVFDLLVSADGKTEWLVGDFEFRAGDGSVSLQAGTARRQNGAFEQPHPVPVGAGPSLFFVDNNRGWCWPNLHNTEDGGNTWKRTPIDEAGVVTNLSFADSGTEGWISAEKGLFQTLDGGKAWRRRSVSSQESRQLKQNLRIPPLWVAFLGLAGIGLVVYGAVQPPLPDDAHPEAKNRPATANLMVDDRPVEHVAEDQLGFRDVAVGLAQFLRNPKTKPPLTVAITGRWGSGKTSIMRMTESELRRERYPTVWFNAWHHRQEASMLAALLTQVRRKVSLPWTTPDGLYFRFRLAWSRLTGANFPRFRVAVAGVLAALGLGHSLVSPEPYVNVARTAGYYGQRGVYEVGELMRDVRSAFGGEEPSIPSRVQPSAPKLDSDLPPKERPASKEDWLVTLLFGGGGLAFTGYLFTLARMFKVLRVDPTKLLTQLLENPKQVDLSEQLGFRSQFAGEFREALESLDAALGERLVIFIDDLDRCRPDHVIDVLETVNYLVSSGPCIIVFGIAEQEVKHYVGLHFAEVAASMKEDPLVFAGHYLEKLINVEVAVPIADADHLHGMAAGETFRTPKVAQMARAEPPKLVRYLYRAKPYAAVGATAASIFLAYWIGADWGRPHSITPGTSSQSSSNESASSAGSSASAGNATANPISPPGTPPAPSQSTNASPLVVATSLVASSSAGAAAWAATVRHRPHVVFADQKAAPSDGALWPYIGFGLAGLVSLFALRSDRLPRTRPVEDSDRFTNALRAWLPLIETRDPSPRTVKRFSNRVRLYALQTRQVDEWSPDEATLGWKPVSWWKWWQSAWWKASGRKQFTLGDSTYDEAMIVAVAAIDDVRPPDIDAETWAARCEAAGQVPTAKPSPLRKGKREKSEPISAGDGPLPLPLQNALAQAIRDHRAAGLDWPPTEACREKVMQLAAVDHG
jgi:Cdc6-like AAA superfamily ATPase